MKNFQIILLVIFGIFAALAAAIFSGAIDLPQKASQTKFGVVGTVSIWGTFPISQIEPSIAQFMGESNGEIGILYTQKSEAEFGEALLESFAFGGTPDVLILPHSLLFQYGNRFTTMPYTTFTRRMFLDTYVESADVFTNQSGMIGFPIFSDPIVMFYNRDILNTANVVDVPKTWKDLIAIVPDLNDINDALEIKTSGIAMGEFSNIRNAKKIISALILQLGNDIVVPGQGVRYESVINERSAISSNPTETVMNFYTEFSNPLSSLYSWNKGIPDSLDAFVGGDLAVYFGPASEFNLIQSKNPNLNFDVADLPQVEGTPARTYADVYSLVIPQNAKNPAAASVVASAFANGSYARALSEATNLTPVRRDLLRSPNPTKPEQEVFFRSALRSKTWLDPDPIATNEIFEDMVENILSGLKKTEDAVEDADRALQVVISNN